MPAASRSRTMNDPTAGDSGAGGGPPYLTRAADFSDAAGIAAVHIAGWRAAYAGIIDEEYLEGLSDIRQAAHWAELLDRDGRAGATFIAETAGDGIVGFGDCGPERGAGGSTAGEITALYVLPARQRRGIGRALVASCARWLVEGGVTGLAIWVLADNGPARSFYAALGGETCESRPVRVAGATLNEVCYRWGELGGLAGPGRAPQAGGLLKPACPGRVRRLGYTLRPAWRNR